MDEAILTRQDAEEIVPMPISAPLGHNLLSKVANHNMLQSRRYSLLYRNINVIAFSSLDPFSECQKNS
jgi:hypothetical protein